MACPIWTKDGSKRVIRSKNVPVRGVYNIPLNFGHQTPKTEILVPSIGLSSVKFFNARLQPWVHCRMLLAIPCRKVQCMVCASGVFLQLLVGQLRPQKLLKFRLWEMPVYIHNAATRRVRSGPKTAQTHHSNEGCTLDARDNQG